MNARCVVCGDEFDAEPGDPAHDLFFDDIRAITWIGENGVMAWPDSGAPPTLAVACGPLVHPREQVDQAIRIHGGAEAFWLFVYEGA